MLNLKDKTPKWMVNAQINHEWSGIRAKPINEPAPGKRKSQIQEFVEEFDGPGIQHVALRVPDIISYVRKQRATGLKFIAPPKEYYNVLKKRILLKF